MASKSGGKRKIGRAKRRPKKAKYDLLRMTMQGMMGRKIRKLMRHNCYTEAQARKHWEQNRKRGM